MDAVALARISVELYIDSDALTRRSVELYIEGGHITETGDIDVILDIDIILCAHVTSVEGGIFIVSE